ncbi:hypothetical protein EDD76_113144 [Kineothrix alysoides]|uniref:Uncharacterized protein n=1 Tax=Kineothrix alysoides TaxID=1469948 RepID=A0A4R1QQB3_9FIRM|nr:hypothetical protein [Kineothrix alysoides]TCL56006.1 hypothetical protein EDD76_113144 [Kineothrix alysoides]
MKATGLDGTTRLGIGVENGRNSKDEKKKEQGNKSVIFAGDIEGMMSDRVESRRTQARKQATKIIMDQFESDEKVSESLNEIRGKIAEMNEQRNELNQRKNNALKRQDKLKETYGIEDESQEQQDLELLRKARTAYRNKDLGNLSEEELEQVANMDALTEYQRKSLALDDVTENCDSLIDIMDKAIAGCVSALTDAKLSVLEQKGMVDAMKGADSIIKAASDAIVGMIMEQSKEHIDEEMDELAEAAGEAAKKKDEQKEKLEEIKSEKQEQEEFIEKMNTNVANRDELQRKLDKIMKDMELLEEDLKGLVVNGQL